MFSVNRDGLFCSVMWLFLCWGGGGDAWERQGLHVLRLRLMHTTAHTRTCVHPSSHTPVQYILITQFCCLFQDDLFTGEGRLAKLHAQCRPRIIPLGLQCYLTPVWCWTLVQMSLNVVMMVIASADIGDSQRLQVMPQASWRPCCCGLPQLPHTH